MTLIAITGDVKRVIGKKARKPWLRGRSHKECSKCHESKPVAEFYREDDSADGYGYRCRECTSMRYANNRDKMLQYSRGRRRTPEGREKDNARGRKYRGLRKTQVKESYLRRKYGISISDYVDMAHRQGGVCAICGRPSPKGLRLCVDHCHRTKRVRGLLCRQCNAGIGSLRDDPATVKSAYKYLMKEPKCS